MALKITPFVVNDIDHLRSICCATAAERPFLPWVDEPQFASALFLETYLELESDSCFVAELDGHIVGYLVGTRNAKSFWCRENVLKHRRLRALLQIHATALVNHRFQHFLSHCVLAKVYWNVLSGRCNGSSDLVYFDPDRFPAQCHLQVLPEARGKGAGLALLLKFQEYLKANGVRGQHGSMVEEVGREDLSSMLLALRFRLVHEKQFTSQDRRTLIHPGAWKHRVLVCEL